MSYRTIRLETDGAVATIQLNRPERMNAVIEAMYLEIQDALARLAASPEHRALILTGSVRRKDGIDKPAFCAGADLKEHAAGKRGAAERRRYIDLAHETVRKLFIFRRPVVAAVNGPARGAGAELALACDFVLMADEATIGLPETGLGTFVGGGVTRVLPGLVGLARAKELIYTGRVLDGRAAVELGLALRSVPRAKLAEEARTLARELAAVAPVPLELAKRALHASPNLDLESALQLETESILTCMETEDWSEGVRAFAERRRPKFKGS